MSNHLPIGVFDSGVGGLTVASAMKAELPNERIFYFGDTARCPYGDKTPGEVLGYSIEVCDFLIRQGVKMLVVACNTATAAALPNLQARYSIPVVGVVEPGARAAVIASNRYNIGVIGTVVTIASGAYEKAVRRLAPSSDVISLACPEFVPLVESGETSGARVHEVVATRLAPFQHRQIDTLILGCTHYPHLQSVIAEVMGEGVRLISSAHETAREVKQILRDEALERTDAHAAKDRYYTSGDGIRMQCALTEWMKVDISEAEVILAPLVESTQQV